MKECVPLRILFQIKDFIPKFIPLRRESNGIKRDAWMSDELREKLRSKHRAWHRIRSKADRVVFRKESKKLKKAIKSAKLQFEKELGERAKKDPKLIHCYIRNKLEVKEQIRVLKDKEGKLVADSKEIAEMLNAQFKSVFSQETLEPLPDFKTRTKVSIDKQKILESLNLGDIERRLKSLKEHKSMGIDGIHPKILRECASAFARPLLTLFCESLIQGKIPDEWKLAIICPIFKKGSRTNPSNY